MGTLIMGTLIMGTLSPCLHLVLCSVVFPSNWSLSVSLPGHWALWLFLARQSTSSRIANAFLSRRAPLSCQHRALHHWCRAGTALHLQRVEGGHAALYHRSRSMSVAFRALRLGARRHPVHTLIPCRHFVHTLIPCRYLVHKFEAKPTFTAVLNAFWCRHSSVAMVQVRRALLCHPGHQVQVATAPTAGCNGLSLSNGGA